MEREIEKVIKITLKEEELSMILDIMARGMKSSTDGKESKLCDELETALDFFTFG
jgi:hypothetical protein